ncbi:hypothetical protein BDZ97DRAFT_1755532 [Flammula alnicola]|nr:hypothetical protein BDZ97DRAFT_1755532 [Flammula alnicola]
MTIEGKGVVGAVRGKAENGAVKLGLTTAIHVAVIIDSFNRVSANTDENEFYGAWNSIEEGYEITPQKVVGHINVGEKDSIDFVISYAITKNQATIFFVEIKARKYLPQRDRRQITKC